MGPDRDLGGGTRLACSRADSHAVGRGTRERLCVARSPVRHVLNDSEWVGDVPVGRTL